MNFYEFMIKNYIDNETPLGDLARDMRDDKEIPKNDDVETVRYLDNKITDYVVEETFKEALHLYIEYTWED